MGSIARLFGGRKRTYRHHAKQERRPGSRFRPVWFDRKQYEALEVIAAGELRTISAVARDVVNVGIANYLHSKMTAANIAESERRRQGLPPHPTRLNRSMGRMRREANSRGFTDEESA